MAKEKNKRPKPESSDLSSKRIYIKQSDVPGASVDEALRLPQAILDRYEGKPTAPLYVAKVLNVDPKGSQFKLVSGAAIAFGLIEGGSQASSISVTDLVRRILRPTEDGADIGARRESVLKPRVFGDFLRKYDGHPFPRPEIACNVLEEMAVPRKKTDEVLDRITNSARSVGFLEEIRGKTYVSLQGVVAEPVLAENHEEIAATPAMPEREVEALPPDTLARARSSGPTELAAAIVDDERRRKVFITHGKNRDLVDPIKKLFEYGELLPIISVERQSVSKPVPEKVMDDMRGCGAAIIHIDVDHTITDQRGTEHVLLNPNVLIEIGAAMAFYGRRFILLVRDGVKLPSNLQGLYEVRYTGETLDANATIKLLEAIKDIKNHGLPSDPSGVGN